MRNHNRKVVKVSKTRSKNTKEQPPLLEKKDKSNRKYNLNLDKLVNKQIKSDKEKSLSPPRGYLDL